MSFAETVKLARLATRGIDRVKSFLTNEAFNILSQIISDVILISDYRVRQVCIDDNLLKF